MSEPFLTTERLELWLPRRSDIAEMYALVSNPVTSRHLGRAADPADHFTRFQRNAGSWFLHGYGSFMLRLRGQSTLIGNCGVFHAYRGLGADFDDMPEGGWIVAADHVGSGLAHEAMRAALDWFDNAHGPTPVVCMIDPANIRSIALAGRLGFVPTRRARLPGSEEDLQLFARPAPGSDTASSP